MTQAFLDTIASHTGKSLIFQLNGETLVHGGYHVTEVKAVTAEAMNCGGRADSWRETVVQLWNAGGIDAREDRVLVNLIYPAVSCKPNDEALAAGEAACCGPATPLISLEALPAQASKGGG